MMDPDYDRDEDRAVARLLSGRDGLSRPEHESILGAVLQATAAEEAAAPQAEPESGWRRWLWPAGLAAALAVGLAVVLSPEQASVPDEPDPFTARGAAEGPQLELRCEPQCSPGATVALEVADSAPFEHVAVFAFREDGAAIWYAPKTADDRSAAVPEGERGLLPFRIALDDAHPPGSYAVVALFSNTPLDRDAIRSAYEKRLDSVAIVERTLVVEEAK